MSGGRQGESHNVVDNMIIDNTEEEESIAQTKTNAGKRKAYTKRSGVWLHVTEFF